MSPQEAGATAQLLHHDAVEPSSGHRQEGENSASWGLGLARAEAATTEVTTSFLQAYNHDRAVGWGFHNSVWELRAEGEWAPSGLAPPLSSYPGLSGALIQDLMRWLCPGWHQLSPDVQSLNQGKDLWIGGKGEEQELVP